MAEKYRDKGLAVLAVGVRPNEGASLLKQYAADQGLKHTILANGPAVATRYGVQATPTTFFIDPQGSIASSHVGFDAARLQAEAAAVLPR